MTTAVLQNEGQKTSTTVGIIGWLLRLTAAVILLQTLFFKFTGASESIYIFTRLSEFLSRIVQPIAGASVAAVIAQSEAVSRIGSGVMELAASVLLLWPRYTWLGAALALAATGGAILSHLTFLGIEVQGDRGLLFALAILVVTSSATLLWLNRTSLPIIGSYFQ